MNREWSEPIHSDVLGCLSVINLSVRNGNHGDPDCWLIGFHPRWLKRQDALHKLQVLAVDGWGSCRISITNALCDWAPAAYSPGYCTVSNTALVVYFD